MANTLALGASAERLRGSSPLFRTKVLPLERDGKQRNGCRKRAAIFYGAGDRDRTGDIQLGKLTFCH